MSAFYESHTSNGGWPQSQSQSNSTFEALKSLTDISPPVREHLTKVYATLAGLCALFAVGAWLHVAQLFLFGGGIFSFLLGLASIVGIYAMPDTQENKVTRYGLLSGFAIMEGLSVGPLLDYAIQLNNSAQLVIIAGIFTGLVFASFTLSALLSEKRAWIYTGGILGSTMSVLLWISFFNMFIGSKWLFTTELYIGLFLFCGYVLYDTQLLVYRATFHGSRDVVVHALDLFIDLVGIFVRILVILIRNSEEREDKKRRSRR